MKIILFAALALASSIVCAEEKPVHLASGDSFDVVLMNPIEGRLNSAAVLPALLRVTSGGLKDCTIVSDVRFDRGTGRFATEGRMIICDGSNREFPVSGQAYFRGVPGIPAHILSMDMSKVDILKDMKPSGGETPAGVKVTFRVTHSLDVIKKDSSRK